MIKSLVFFDLDGTLLNDDSVILDKVESAIAQLKKNGHLPIIATGRPYSQISDILEKTIIDSYILLNGQTIIVENEVIFESKFDYKLIKELNEMADYIDIQLAYYGANSHVISKKTPIVEKSLNYFNILPPVEDNLYYEKNEVMMMLLFTDNLEHDTLFKERFPNLSFYRTSPYSIDVIHSENSKATSIVKLAEHMEYTDLPIYAFGDSMNDIEMLEKATYSISMGNAVNKVKETSDIVVSSNNDNGIIEGLSYYSLI